MNLNESNVYIFIYCYLGEGGFDMRLSPATPTNINRALLRARLNSQRKLTVYGIKLTEKQHEVCQDKWNKKEIPSYSLFQQLQEIGIVEIPW